MNYLKTKQLLTKMKYKIIAVVTFVAFAFVVNAQNTTKEMTVDGVKVIFKKINKKVVTASLIVRGGTANYDKAKEGVEQFALSLATQGGTKMYDKNSYNTTLEKMGSTISANSSYDYGSINVTSLKRNFDETWKLFVDVVNNPLMPESEFDLLKSKMIAAVQQSDANPDVKLRNLAMVNSFTGSPYANISEGTEASLNTITLADLNQHFEKVVTKNNVFLVVVGDLEEADLLSKVEALVATLPEGEKLVHKYGKLEVSGSNVVPQQRDIKTNYIRGYMNAPAPNDSDHTAMQVAMQIVRDRLFKEIRTKRNLSYSPQAYLPGGVTKAPYVVWYVTTDKPNESIQLMYDEINKLRTGGFTEKELKDKKAGFLTQYFMRQEGGRSQAQTIASAEISGVGWKKIDTYLNRVNNLSIADLNDAFKKYATGVQWTYLGDDTIIDEAVFNQELPPINVKEEIEKVDEEMQTEEVEPKIETTKKKKKWFNKRKKNKKTFRP